jgi:hypothetical protein
MLDKQKCFNDRSKDLSNSPFIAEAVSHLDHS